MSHKRSGETWAQYHARLDDAAREYEIEQRRRELEELEEDLEKGREIRRLLELVEKHDGPWLAALLAT